MTSQKRKFDEMELEENKSFNYNKLKYYIEYYIKNIENDKKRNVIEFRNNLIESNEYLSYSKFDIIYNDAKYNIASLWENEQ